LLPAPHLPRLQARGGPDLRAAGQRRLHALLPRRPLPGERDEHAGAVHRPRCCLRVGPLGCHLLPLRQQGQGPLHAGDRAAGCRQGPAPFPLVLSPPPRTRPARVSPSPRRRAAFLPPAPPAPPASPGSLSGTLPPRFIPSIPHDPPPLNCPICSNRYLQHHP